ncbi:pentatricopeptide repeat-containing protein At3g26630, chloroplastic-like [Nymphaea colorata]|uniref:pentatricopeptide repeat-containing protein At3g26630, chloroplastic-like n=1 Tax=Nymphaea colorata TaxID=210225 RepID=UPI00129D89CE|nr:pentatricopeptide repeat-containing protein At3g26630, chloroplastic-like [Nymphaea colorata]
MLSLISACAGLGSEKLCRCIHSFTVKLRIDAHLKVGNALLEMYSSIGAIDDASKLFNIMQVKDVISWTTMINMYGSAGCPVNALKFFWQMRSANVEPDMVSMVALLSACAVLGDLQKLKIVHNQIILWGLGDDIFFDVPKESSYLEFHDFKVYNEWPSRKCYEIDDKDGNWGSTNKMDAALSVNGLSAIADLANLGLCKQVHAYIVICDIIIVHNRWTSYLYSYYVVDDGMLESSK